MGDAQYNPLVRRLYVARQVGIDLLDTLSPIDTAADTVLVRDTSGSINRKLTISALLGSVLPNLASTISGGVLTLAGTLTTARTWTFPDAAGTFAGINVAQTWTANQTFAANILASGSRNIGATGTRWAAGYFAQCHGTAFYGQTLELTSASLESSGALALIDGTFNDAGAICYGLDLNITNTASDALSRAIRVQVGGAEVLGLTLGGHLYGGAAAGAWTLRHAAQDGYLDLIAGTTGGTDPRIRGYGSTHATLANRWQYAATTHAWYAANGTTEFASLSSSGLSLTTTSTITTLCVTDTGVNGGNIKIVGDGATTPNKYIRSKSGALDVINSGYTATILSLSDAGALSCYNDIATSKATDVLFKATRTGDSVSAIMAAVTGAAYIGAQSNHPLQLCTNNTTRLIIAADGSTAVFGSSSASASLDCAGRTRFHYDQSTGEYGMQVALVNKTGAASVKGQIVRASTGTDMAYDIAPASSDEPIGVVYNAGVADAGYVWIWTSGAVAQVLLKDGTASTRGYWAETSDTAGRADMSNADPVPATHPQEIGHCLESKSSGTDVLARAILHWN